MKSVMSKRDASSGDGEKLGKGKQFIKFEIHDSGQGIPEDKMNFIFNLFESDLMAISNLTAIDQKCKINLLTPYSC